ncbi:hypothetical protein SLA2020_237560 [Shorea laevis]
MGVEDGSEDIVKEGWQYTRDQSSMAQILSKTSNCGALLMDWGEARLWIGAYQNKLRICKRNYNGYKTEKQRIIP